MKKLRPYQIQNAIECGMILTAYGIVYMQHTQANWQNFDRFRNR
jgi:hypothetical protein